MQRVLNAEEKPGLTQAVADCRRSPGDTIFISEMWLNGEMATLCVSEVSDCRVVWKNNKNMFYWKPLLQRSKFTLLNQEVELLKSMKNNHFGGELMKLA